MPNHKILPEASNMGTVTCLYNNSFMLYCCRTMRCTCINCTSIVHEKLFQCSMHGAISAAWRWATYDDTMTDSNWRYNTEVTNGTSNTAAVRCPKHNLPLDDIPTPPPTLTKGKTSNYQCFLTCWGKLPSVRVIWERI